MDVRLVVILPLVLAGCSFPGATEEPDAPSPPPTPAASPSPAAPPFPSPTPPSASPPTPPTPSAPPPPPSAAPIPPKRSEIRWNFTTGPASPVPLGVSGGYRNCAAYAAAHILQGEVNAAWEPETPVAEELEVIVLGPSGVLGRVAGVSPLAVLLPEIPREGDFSFRVVVQLAEEPAAPSPVTQDVAVAGWFETPGRDGAPGASGTSSCARVE